MTVLPPSAVDVDVFVHLSHGVDAKRWRTGWESGTLIGINEPSPYGYDRANSMGCHVTYSVPAAENAVTRLARLGVRAILGFDFVHAWHNRVGIRSADVVWTHTETQGLAVAALLLIGRRGAHRPATILQNVWLIDRWSRYPLPWRWLFRKLLGTASVLTFHSMRNRNTAAILLAPARCELVKFGIRADDKVEPRVRHPRDAIAVLSLGNDEHRDWSTAVEGVGLLDNHHLTVLSSTFPRKLAQSEHVTVGRVKDNSELIALFADADVVLIALKPNEHASGLTVLQEAILHGVPVVVTDAGGLTDYFDSTLVSYVPPGDAGAIAEAITRIVGDPEAAAERAKKAQAQMSPEHISSESYVRRHVELSIELLRSTASR